MRELLERAKTEYGYWSSRKWTLEDVGQFWDTVTEYDEINEKIYPYFKRFTNSYALVIPFLPRNDYRMLDIQARSGKGSLFWHQHQKLKTATCVDFSDYLLSLADRRLKNTDLDSETFDFVCTYETVEHVCDFDTFLQELTRVMTQDGVMILTCPNRAWDWVHSLTYVMGTNHSEGPHRFLYRRELLEAFTRHGLNIVCENSTIVLPFNSPMSKRLDLNIERNIPESIRRYLALRRTFILKKA